MRRLLPSIAAALLIAACNASDNAGPTPLPGTDAQLGQATTSWEAVVANAGRGAMPIKLYSQNVYPGFNIDNLVIGLIQTSGSGNPAYFLDSLAVAMTALDATDWRERAARMVLEIEAQNPDVVALQEMVTVERAGLQLLGLPFPDERVEFLEIFREELAKRGLPYVLVDTLPLTYAPIPIDQLFGLPVPPGTVFATYYDRDAMFVRENVGIANVRADTFAVGLQEVVYQTRGWIQADLTLRGKTWRVIGTHPNPGWPAGPGQPTQVQELLTAAGGSTLPVVIAGDLNLEPTSPEYAQLTAAGFLDLLQAQYGATAAGNTCCQSDDALRNPAPTLTKRIDYVMVRPATGYALGPFDIEPFGDERADRTATGMWTSDHAGLLARLVLQKTHGD